MTNLACIRRICESEVVGDVEYPLQNYRQVMKKKNSFQPKYFPCSNSGARLGHRKGSSVIDCLLFARQRADHIVGWREDQAERQMETHLQGAVLSLRISSHRMFSAVAGFLLTSQLCFLLSQTYRKQVWL